MENNSRPAIDRLDLRLLDILQRRGALSVADVAAQTRETLTNIDALLDEANRIVGSAHYALEALKFKVYVRRVSDFAAIESVLSAALHSSTTIVYLQADVCREDLLVEIEATGDSRS